MAEGVKMGEWGRLLESAAGKPQSKEDTTTYRPQVDPPRRGRSPGEMRPGDQEGVLGGSWGKVL